jgi:hypothetical protein
MSREYARSRVRDALLQSGGNFMQAQRMLLMWMEKDVDLILGLVDPHMQNIISYAIGHEIAEESKREASENRKAAGTVIKGKGNKPAPEKSLAAAIEDDLSDFGKSLLSSLKGGARFGEEQPRGTVSRPGKASQSHIDALRTMATASAVKSGKSHTVKSKSPSDVLKKGKKTDD